MAKRIYQVGEPCDVCQTPTVQGKDGNGYCKPCYVAWKNKQEGLQPTSNGQAPYRPTKEALGQRKEMFNVMEKKAETIGNFQKAKEDSMRIYSSGRDAVLVVTNMYPELSSEILSANKEQAIKEEIIKWQKFFANSIYNDKPFV
jgi:uncharacterized Zn finger protein (UPF0148 family)